MLTIYRFAILMLFAALLSCGPSADKYQDPFRVISDSANIYQRTETTSKALKELKFGEEVRCREKNPSYAVARGWIEASSGTVRGFIEKKAIAGQELYREMQTLIDGAKGAQVQAGGLTGKKVSIRLKPDKGAFIIETVKKPGNADIFERIIVTTGEGEKAKREIWYKIRLDDGRVGFVPRSNIQLIPPSEINVYTQVRTPVTWYRLREKEDPATGQKGSDYLVTYSSVGSDIDTDFTRIELYVYDLTKKQYSTALAKSGLYGILPVKITDDGAGGKLIEIREHPHGDKTKVHVLQYSFPKPIKIVKEYVE